LASGLFVVSQGNLTPTIHAGWIDDDRAVCREISSKEVSV
jgi:hypothetical protein